MNGTVFGPALARDFKFEKINLFMVMLLLRLQVHILGRVCTEELMQKR